jgi:hypothetical protein
MARRRQQFNGSLSTSTNNNVLSQDSISNNDNNNDGDVGGSTVGSNEAGAGTGAGENGRQMHGNVRSTVIPRLTTDPLHTDSHSHAGKDTEDGPTAVVLEKKPHVPRGTESRAYPHPPAAAAANDYGGHHELHQHRGGGSQNQGQSRNQNRGQGQGQGQNQGQGQGRSRGKGKDGPPHPHKLNHSAKTPARGQQPVEGGGEHLNLNDNDDVNEEHDKEEEEQNAEEENEEEEEDEESCFICAEKIKYYSGGVCGHKTCQ